MKKLLFSISCVMLALAFLFVPNKTLIASADQMLSTLEKVPAVSQVAARARMRLNATHKETQPNHTSMRGRFSPRLRLHYAQAAAAMKAQTYMPSSNGGSTGSSQTSSADVGTQSFSEDFENKFAGKVTKDVADGWTMYVNDGQPTLDGEFFTRRNGDWAQKISGYASFHAGIYRTFETTAGTPYSVTVWCQLYPLGDGSARLGVSNVGSTDPISGTIAWVTTDALGQWVELTSSGTAQANTITVFLEADNPLGDNTNAYFDDFSITLGGVAVEAQLPTTGGVLE